MDICVSDSCSLWNITFFKRTNSNDIFNWDQTIAILDQQWISDDHSMVEYYHFSFELLVLIIKKSVWVDLMYHVWAHHTCMTVQWMSYSLFADSIKVLSCIHYGSWMLSLNAGCCCHAVTDLWHYMFLWNSCVWWNILGIMVPWSVICSMLCDWRDIE